MSTKAERKRKAVKQARKGSAETSALSRDRRSKARVAVEAYLDSEMPGWRLSNQSFVADETLRPLLVAGAKAAGADLTSVFVHADENANDHTHPHDNGRELHLAVPPKGGDALQSATELFRRIVRGWSFITNIQSGRNDGRAEMCNDCIEAVVEEHAPLIQDLAGVYAVLAA
jgi:hypothetical protein